MKKNHSRQNCRIVSNTAQRVFRFHQWQGSNKKLKEKTNLPGSWQKANGQTLHYILGGGPNAGVIAKKDVSQYFADMPIDESADSFIPMPELAGIDNIDL